MEHRRPSVIGSVTFSSRGNSDWASRGWAPPKKGVEQLHLVVPARAPLYKIVINEPFIGLNIETMKTIESPEGC